MVGGETEGGKAKNVGENRIVKRAVEIYNLEGRGKYKESKINYHTHRC